MKNDPTVCPECGGNGWTYSPCDDKINCPKCNGMGAVDSGESSEGFGKEVVWVNGRAEVRDIDPCR